jgi:hypothetical protein
MATLGPLQSQIYADPILSNVSIAYQNAQHVADMVFPEVQVATRTGIYYKYGKEKFTQKNDLRAPGTYANQVKYSLTKVTYGPLLDHSLDIKIEDEITDDAVAPLDPAFDAVETLTEMISVNKELDAYNQCSNGSVITQNVTLSGTSRWDDYANSDPIGDFVTAIDTVKKAVVKTAKELTILIGYEAFSVLRNHPQMLERIKYSERGIITSDVLREVLGVKQVIIGESEYNTANENQTASMSYIWGKNAWVMYIVPSPTIRTVTFGYTLRKGGRQVLRFRDDRAESEFVRVKDYYQQHIMASDAAYLMTSVVN